MKNLFSILLAILLVFSNISFIHVNAAVPDIAAKGAVVMDAETGRILYQKNMNGALPMASTTKIMTAIIAMEDGNLNDTVTISQNAASVEPVKLGLKKGEKIKLEYLLYAMLMESSNDAAIAIAEHVHGSVDNFCKIMTEKAKKIGAKNTTFQTPNGLDANWPKHMSTAYDMALIMKYATNNKNILKVMQTKNKSFSSSRKSYSVTNKNRFLTEYTGMIGGKTGLTNKAGHCFVGAAERNGVRLISVVLNSGSGSTGKERKWSDTRKLLDYGFNNYKDYSILDGSTKQVGEIQVTNSNIDSIPVYIKGYLKVPIKSGEEKYIKLKYDYQSTMKAPIAKNQKVGTASVLLGETVLAKYDIFASQSAKLIEESNWAINNDTYNDVPMNNHAAEAINSGVENHYLSGIADQKFGYGKQLTRRDASVIIAKAYYGADKVPNTPATFTDTPNDFYSTYIGSLQPLGISGYKDKSFHPREVITRAEFVQMLVTVFKLQSDEGAEVLSFTDVPEGHWGKNSIDIFSSKYHSNGFGDGLWLPSKVITREQAAQFLYYVMNTPEIVVE